MKPIEHIVLAALLHDIGKACGDDNFTKNNGLFCDTLTKKFQMLNSDNNSSDKNHWLNLTKNYYKPNSNDSTEHKIMGAADYFASAEREEGFDENIKVIKSNTLIPILERVDLDNNNHDTYHKLPCKKLLFDHSHLFPFKEKTQEIKQTQLIDHHFDPNMIKEIESIPAFKGNSLTDESTQLRCITRFLLSIFEKYLSQIPANINTNTPDVSLFDHLRITAAIAEGLYKYHKCHDDLKNDSNFRDKEISKWLLVCGDFSGIQNFIYKLTSENAANALRGRSFYIQLLCDASAHYIINTLNQFPTALIYSSGGKFYLLIPNTLHYKTILKESSNDINAWLLKEFRGEMFMGIGYTEVSGKDFQAGQMGRKWKEANEALQKNRLQRFSDQILDPPESDAAHFFAPQELHANNLVCKACSRNDSKAEIDIDKETDTPKCKHCRKLEKIGQKLTRSRYLLWNWSGLQIDCNPEDQYPFPFNKDSPCQLIFYNTQPDLRVLESLNDYSIEIINDLESTEGFGFRFIGKWNLYHRHTVKEFHEFANDSIGVKRLGILRMDVDNLGEIFVRGFDFLTKSSKKEMEMGSLSRVATMSRQLNLFFSGYLNHIVQIFNEQKKCEKAQIIYSGGDDLFIIGSWDAMPEIAREIQQQFTQYCVNKYFTLSAGIAMVGGKYPIHHAAMIAGTEEAKAKAIGDIIDQAQPPTNTDRQKQKNALCFMGAVVGWEMKHNEKVERKNKDYREVEPEKSDYDAAVWIKNKIITIIKKTNNRAIIDKLNTVILNVRIFEQMKKEQNKDYSFQKMYELVCFQKWRWQFIFNLHRMASRYSDDSIKNDLKELQDKIIHLNHNSRLPVLNWLEMPVRWADFLTRKEKEIDE